MEFVHCKVPIPIFASFVDAGSQDRRHRVRENDPSFFLVPDASAFVGEGCIVAAIEEEVRARGLDEAEHERSIEVSNAG